MVLGSATIVKIPFQLVFEIEVNNSCQNVGFCLTASQVHVKKTHGGRPSI